MRKTPILSLFITLGAIAAPTAWGQAAVEPQKFEQARSALEKWVETRKLISEERNQWETERETLRDTIEVLRAEIETLEDNIARAEEGATQADVQREELSEANDALKAVASTISQGVGRIEQRLLGISKFFPEELSGREGVQVLLKRIPSNPETTRAGLSERMTNIVGVLIEVDKFHNTVTPTNELRKLPSGETVQVRTLYLGLGTAYYVDATGQYAGILTPGPEGWVDNPRNDLSETIQLALAIYDNAQQPTFVNVPVEIK